MFLLFRDKVIVELVFVWLLKTLQMSLSLRGKLAITELLLDVTEMTSTKLVGVSSKSKHSKDIRLNFKRLLQASLKDTLQSFRLTIISEILSKISAKDRKHIARSFTSISKTTSIGSEMKSPVDHIQISIGNKLT